MLTKSSASGGGYDGGATLTGGHNMFGDNYTGDNNPPGYYLAPRNQRDAISV